MHGRDRIDLVLLVVLAGEHRPDRARRRVQRHEPDVRRRAVVRVVRGRRPRLVRGILRRALPVRVERRDDAEAPFGERLVALFRRCPQERVPAVRVVVDLLLHVIDDERWRRQMDLADVLRQPERLHLRPGSAFGRHAPVGRAEPDHPIEDVVAPQPRSARVPQRIVGIGCPDHPGQQGRLWQRELRGRHVEIELCRRSDAVDVVPEVDLVQVHLQDLVLRVPLLDAHRQRDLLELATERPVGRIAQGELHQLLGDRRPPLNHLPGPDVRGQGAQHRRGIESPVFVEPRILDREDRLPCDGGDLAERQDLAVSEVDAGEDRLPVVRIDRGPLGDRRDPREVRPGRLELLVELLHAHAHAHEGRGDDDGGQAGRRDDHRHEQQERDRFV